MINKLILILFLVSTLLLAEELGSEKVDSFDVLEFCKEEIDAEASFSTFKACFCGAKYTSMLTKEFFESKFGSQERVVDTALALGEKVDSFLQWLSELIHKDTYSEQEEFLKASFSETKEEISSRFNEVLVTPYKRYVQLVNNGDITIEQKRALHCSVLTGVFATSLMARIFGYYSNHF